MFDSTQNPNEGNSTHDRTGSTTEIHWDGDEPFHVALLDAVESATNVAATDLDPISETVDVESVEGFVRNSDSRDLYVSFSYEGCYVEVCGDRSVVVTPFRNVNPN